MVDFEDVINTRRSVRVYADREVGDEEIEKILRAGMQAPYSRLGAEPWEFVVIRDRKTLDKPGRNQAKAFHSAGGHFACCKY